MEKVYLLIPLKLGGLMCSTKSAVSAKQTLFGNWRTASIVAVTSVALFQPVASLISWSFLRYSFDVVDMNCFPAEF